MPGSPTDPRAVAVSAPDYLWYVDHALGQMTRIVAELGDSLVNGRPPLPGANSPYVILTHCLGVMEYWGGATIADRAWSRDRAAEFTASGDVAPLLERVTEARARLEADLTEVDSFAPPANVWPDPDDPRPYDERRGAVLLHILEELYQHLGQMEITRDALLAAR
jgi:hypothetical protein